MEARTLKLGHLYPKELNLYGDIGNIITLKKRCEWRGIELIVDNINLNDEISEHDIYFIGGGQDKQQIDVAKDIQRHKDFLTKERDNNKIFLGICGGYQLLGHYYQPHNGEKLLGISLLDAYTVAGKNRFIGNVTAKIENLEPSTLVGFENHSGLTYLQGETKPLATISIGRGNNGEDNTEGARFKNIFGTYLHGSLLPKNPHFADLLISLALQNKYNKTKLGPLNDDIELLAHNSAIGKQY